MAKKDKKWEPPAVRTTAAFSRMLSPSNASAPSAPPVPTQDEAADNAGKDMGNSKRRGFQSTILGGRQQAAAEPQPRKTLLGQ